jgi:CRP-like cAMP-binding protein
MFKGAEPGAVALLALLMAHQTHTPEENIIFEGETNLSIYFVHSGELSVYKRGTSAKRVSTASLGGGSRASRRTSAKPQPLPTGPAVGAAEQPASSGAGKKAFGLRNVAREVMAINRMTNVVGEDEESMQKRVQAMKNASLLDIATLGQKIGRLTDGATFGEQSYLTGKASMATVRTVTFCEVMSLGKADLDHAIDAYPRLRTDIDSFATAKAAGYQEQNQKIRQSNRRGSTLLTSIFADLRQGGGLRRSFQAQHTRRPTVVAGAQPRIRRSMLFRRSSSSARSSEGERESGATEVEEEEPAAAAEPSGCALRA